MFTSLLKKKLGWCSTIQGKRRGLIRTYTDSVIDCPFPIFPGHFCMHFLYGSIKNEAHFPFLKKMAAFFVCIFCTPRMARPHSGFGKRHCDPIGSQKRQAPKNRPFFVWRMYPFSARIRPFVIRSVFPIQKCTRAGRQMGNGK